MTELFSSIILLQDMHGKQITRPQVEYISTISKLKYDDVLQLLFVSNEEIVRKEGISLLEQVTSVPITQYQVAKFALTLEEHVCKLVIYCLRKYALIREASSALFERLEEEVGIDEYAVRIFLYSLTIRKFSKAQDAMLQKVVVDHKQYEPVMNCLEKGGRGYLEMKYRIGTLYNTNYFSKAEIQYILLQKPEFLNNEALIRLESSGAALRFSCELSNWYSGKKEEFWAFPEQL